MSIFFKIKEVWDLLHPSKSAEIGLITGGVVVALVLTPAWLPALIIGATVYGIALGIDKLRNKKKGLLDVQNVMPAPTPAKNQTQIRSELPVTAKPQPAQTVSVTWQSIFKEDKEIGATSDPELKAAKTVESQLPSSLRR